MRSPVLSVVVSPEPRMHLWAQGWRRAWSSGVTFPASMAAGLPGDQPPFPGCLGAPAGGLSPGATPAQLRELPGKGVGWATSPPQEQWVRRPTSVRRVSLGPRQAVAAQSCALHTVTGSHAGPPPSGPRLGQLFQGSLKTGTGGLERESGQVPAGERAGS